MRTHEFLPTPQEQFWNSIDDEGQENFAIHGDLSSDIPYEIPRTTPIMRIQPEQIAKNLLAYVTGTRE